MAAQQEGQAPETIALTPIKAQGCDGVAIKGFYDAQNKRVYCRLTGFSGLQTITRYTANKLFEELLAQGTDSDDYHLLLDAVPEFKTLDRELTNTLQIRYNPGDQVVIYEDRTPVVFVADKIVSISFACTDSGKKKTIINRVFLSSRDPGRQIVMDEYSSRIFPITEVAKSKEIDRLVKKLKKEFKMSDEIIGCIITYKGKHHHI
jgi:hypothetical protein